MQLAGDASHRKRAWHVARILNGNLHIVPLALRLVGSPRSGDWRHRLPTYRAPDTTRRLAQGLGWENIEISEAMSARLGMNLPGRF